MHSPPWAPRLGVVFGYLLAALLFAWPLPLHLGSAFTGDPGGDTGVYIWNQWVFQYEALNHHTNPLTTEQILSLTQRVDLSQHNYTAFLNLLALPLIPWLGVVLTFNVVYLIATVLTALATYALVRRVTQATRGEAWLAGMLFAWSPVLVARSTAHFSLVAAAPLPAFLLCLIAADRSRELRYAALAGLCMAWAAFCDVYYAIYCLMIAIGYVGLRVVRITRAERPATPPVRWVLDVLILAVGGLIVGLLLGRGGRFELLGIPISIRGLYTPVFVLTTLVGARVDADAAPARRGRELVAVAIDGARDAGRRARLRGPAVAGAVRARRAADRRPLRATRRSSGAAARAAATCSASSKPIPITRSCAASTTRSRPRPRTSSNTRRRSAWSRSP